MNKYTYYIRGSISIEASLIVPFIIILLYSFILLGFKTRGTFYNNVSTYQDKNEEIYSSSDAIVDKVLLYDSIIKSIEYMKKKGE